MNKEQQKQKALNYLKHHTKFEYIITNTYVDNYFMNKVEYVEINDALKAIEIALGEN